MYIAPVAWEGGLKCNTNFNTENDNKVTYLKVTAAKVHQGWEHLPARKMRGEVNYTYRGIQIGRLIIHIE